MEDLDKLINEFHVKYEKILSDKQDLIDSLKNTLNAKDLEIKKLRNKIHAQEKILNKEFLTYKFHNAKSYNLRIDTEKIKIKGRDVCIGKYKKQASEINYNEVLNLTDYFFPDDNVDLFDTIYGHKVNIYQRVNTFINKNKQKLLNKKYFVIATHPDKKTSLSNVNAAITFWLLKNLEDVIFINPMDFLKNPLCSINTDMTLINLSTVSRWVNNYLKCNIDIKKNGINYVNCQQYISKNKKIEIRNHIRDKNAKIIEYNVEPGSYVNGIPNLDCEKYDNAVAQLILQFTEVSILTKMCNVKQMYMFLNDFSGYSIYTMAVIHGFEFDKYTTMLCDYKFYSHFNLF